MTTRRLPLLTAAILIGLTVALAASAASAAPQCLIGSGAFTTPATACTPGAWVGLTRAQVCESKDRTSLPAAERRKILTRYNLASWTGKDGELDHRVPFFLGGTTDARNVWPERGGIPNAKDRLEDYVRRRVCVQRTMTVRTARRLFLVDWTMPYHRYIAP